MIEFSCCNICIDPSEGIDYDNLPSCEKAWELYELGYTKSIFQLEKSWTRRWPMKFKPKSIKEASALIAAIRPGTLKYKFKGEDGVERSATEHMALRKFGKEKIEYVHESVIPILEETQGIICMQEQMMKLVSKTAGFSLEEAGRVRKGVSKKDAKLLLEIQEEYIKRAKEFGVVDEQSAKAIFDNIFKAARYSFCAAHSTAYAIEGYKCAWVKAHFPLEWACEWLKNSKSEQKPQEEVQELVAEIKRMKIGIQPPDLRDKSSDFYIDENDFIKFGLANVKGVGEKKIESLVEKLKDVQFTCWSDTISIFLKKGYVDKTTGNALIRCGALDYCGLARKYMEHVFINCQILTERERNYISEHFDETVADTIEIMLEDEAFRKTKSRVEKLKDLMYILRNPPASVKDTSEYLSMSEKELLGVPISCTKLEDLNVSYAQITTDHWGSIEDKQKISIALQIEGFRETTIKNGQSKGQKMAFFTGIDLEGSIDCVVFAENFEKYRYLFYENNTVFLVGAKSNRGSLMIYEAYQT